MGDDTMKCQICIRRNATTTVNDYQFGVINVCAQCHASYDDDDDDDDEPERIPVDTWYNREMI